MEIKEGHYYRRRDDVIVGPAVRTGHAKFPWIMGDDYTENYGVHYKIPSPFTGTSDLIEDLGPDYPACEDCYSKEPLPRGDGMPSVTFLGTEFKMGADVNCSMPTTISAECLNDRLAGMGVLAFGKKAEEPMKERASRHNTGKTQWFRLPFDCLEDVVKVMEMGSQKYPDAEVDDTGRGKPNWSKDGTPYTEFAESCMRHLLAWRNGEDSDKESNLPHLAHMIAGALFLMYYQKHGLGVDDRLRSRGLRSANRKEDSND